jgi:GST-like protein
MYELYYYPTPNGMKVTILFEELAVPYKIVTLNIGSGDQFSPNYLKIAPNNRMPALVDHAPKDGGAPISVFESAAIMMYVAEKEGRYFPQNARGKYAVVQWLMWQMANQGPKMGEQTHFRRAAKDPKNGDLAYATKRFDDEVHRLYGVMNLGLHKKSYLAGDDYSIADMCCYAWASTWAMRAIELEEFPNVKRWMDEVAARPAVQKGMAVSPENLVNLSTLSEKELEELTRQAKPAANQRARPVPTEWD